MKEIIGEILRSEEGKKVIRIGGYVGVGVVGTAFAYRIATGDVKIKAGKFKAEFKKFRKEAEA